MLLFLKGVITLWKEIYFTDFEGVIHDYRGLYKINVEGEVYSCKRNNLLKTRFDKDGYKRVALYKKGKTRHYPLHRLLAFMFIPIIDKTKTVVNHIDECKTNNSLENLEWCTVRQNNTHGTRMDRVQKKRRETMSTKEWRESNTGDKNTKSKKVVSVNIYTLEVKTYVSIREASKAHELKSYTTITHSVKHQRVTRNHLWFEAEVYEKMGYDELVRLIEYKKQQYEKHYHGKK